MKTFITLLFFSALIATSASATADSLSLNPANSRVLPVLVQVNRSGKVVRVSPSSSLSVRYGRLLRQNIEEIVSGPAMQHEKPVSSQLIMNMSLKTVQRDDGNYETHFAYVSSRPAPPGPVHWESIDGRQLALVRDRPDTWRRDNDFRQRITQPNYYPRPSSPSTMPASVRTSPASSGNAASGRRR